MVAATDSIVITTPAPSTASRAVPATTAPASASGPVADAERSHTFVFRARGQQIAGHGRPHVAGADHRDRRPTVSCLHLCHYCSFLLSSPHRRGATTGFSMAAWPVYPHCS